MTKKRIFKKQKVNLVSSTKGIGDLIPLPGQTVILLYEFSFPESSIVIDTTSTSTMIDSISSVIHHRPNYKEALLKSIEKTLHRGIRLVLPGIKFDFCHFESDPEICKFIALLVKKDLLPFLAENNSHQSSYQSSLDFSFISSLLLEPETINYRSIHTLEAILKRTLQKIFLEEFKRHIQVFDFYLSANAYIPSRQQICPFNFRNSFLLLNNV